MTDTNSQLSHSVLYKKNPLHKKRFNVLYENIRSLNNKMNDVTGQVEEEMQNGIILHIIGITESWLNDNNVSQIKLKDYSTAHSLRKAGRGGGSTFFVHSSLDFNPSTDILLDMDFEGSNILLINIKKIKIKLLIIYRESKTNLQKFYKILDDILQKNSNLILMGDLNLCLLKTESQPFKNLIQSNGHGFLNNINKKAFTIKNQFGTRLIDHITTDLFKFNYIMNIKEISFSDHLAIKFSFDKTVSTKSITIKKINHLMIHRETTNALTQNTYNSFDHLIKDLQSIILRNTKEIKTKEKYESNKWFNDRILQAIKLREKIKKRLRVWPTNQIIKSQFIKQKNYVTYIINKSRKDFYMDRINNCEGDLRKMFVIFKEIIFGNAVKSSFPTKISKNGLTTRNLKDICNIFNNEFIEIPIDLNNQLDINNNFRAKALTMQYTNSHSIFIENSTINEIIIAINELKNNKAPGFDSITTTHIKNHHLILAPIISRLINDSLNSGTFPEILKQTKIIPLHKSGDQSIVSNYRPIALLSNIEKVVEKFIHSKIVSFLEKKNILGLRQFGFRQNSGTLSATINILSRAQEAIDSGFYVAIMFLDLSKAFDCVNHDVLLNKLYKIGLRGSLWNFMKNYLMNRPQITVINGVKSDIKLSNLSVPQGAIFSPTLFSIYSKDLDELPLKGYLQNFADDNAALYIENSISKLESNMQFDLNLIYDWLYNNSLTANPSKTKYMLFSTKSSSMINLNLKMNNQKIEKVDCYKYLGLFIQSNLKWNKHVENISRKVSRFLGCFFKASKILPVKIRLNLYYSYIFPHLIYLNPIWCNASNKSNYLFKELQILQNKFIRNIFSEEYYKKNIDSMGNKLIHTAELYQKYKILTLEQINIKESAQITHKIMNENIIIDLKIKKNKDVHNYHTRNKNDIHLFKVKTNCKKNGFLHKSAVVFNKLPVAIKSTNNYYQFKKLLKNHLLNSGIT